MADEQQRTQDLCEHHLTATDLRRICAHRGWTVRAASKEALTAFVAPRLTGTEGVERAMASLGERGLLLLHRFAAFPEQHDVRTLLSDQRRATHQWNLKARPFFRSLVEDLLDRGVVLAGEREGSRIRDGGKLEDLCFAIPKDHLPLLPPFPIPTEPLGAAARLNDLREFMRDVLLRALEAERAEPGEPDPVLDSIAQDITFTDSSLCLPGKKRLTGSGLLETHVLKRMSSARKKPPRAESARAAHHVLTHLPGGCGCTPSDLAQAVERLGEPLSEEQADALCADGHRVGLLTRGGAARPIYAAAMVTSPDVAASAPPDATLVLTPIEGGARVEVDVRASDVGAVLELAAVSLVEPANGRLRLGPSRLHLGRSWDRLDQLPTLGAARSLSPGYETAVREVKARRGQTLLHLGLAVLRVDDLGLRTLLAHRLGDRARSLGGPYLAVVEGALGEVEQWIKKEGFSPRRVSA